MASNNNLIGEILRAGGRLNVARNNLLAGFGMTSARLRLLKTIRRLPVAFTVSELARAMIVSRQTVQPTVRELEAAGLVRLTVNMRNRKAPLVALTPLGLTRLEELVRLEERWVADLTRGFDEHVLEQTAWVIRMIRERSSD